VSIPWIDVNMPWRISRSTDAATLGDQFIAAVEAAKAKWQAEHPDHVRLASVSSEFEDVFEIQDQYPWLREHLLTTTDVEAWRDNALRLCDDIEPGLRVKFRALVIHRYWYRLESDYINKDPDVIRTQAACESQRVKERGQEFVNHSACQVGVQIEILSNGETKRLLIGDIVPSGMDSGCCQEGIRDEDIVVRYRDLRHLIQEP
jgi:hypothetical protein